MAKKQQLHRARALVLSYILWLSSRAVHVPIVSGLVVMLFGLHFLGIIRIGFLNREARLDAGTQPSGIVGSYVMGLAFGFGWTPCVGPALAAILMVASGMGITVLPESAANIALYSEHDLVVRPFQEPSPYRTIALAWRVSYPRPQVIDLLAEALKD